MLPIKRAGRYRVHERIAAGGMGEVYKATMISLEGVEKIVAIKLLRPDLALDPSFLDLFVEEARVVMSLSHANIVQAFDVGKLEDQLFLSMEYVNGVDLLTLLKTRRGPRGDLLDMRCAVLIAVEALKGLDYAHRLTDDRGQLLGLVHCDISPSNLLISREGEVKVADFGIAQTRLRATAERPVRGKLPYMAPEQLQGVDVDARADVYALGAVLFEMLTGQRTVAADDTEEAIKQITSGHIPSPREVRPTISEDLEQIVVKSLALDPHDRYRSAADMRHQLEAFSIESQALLSTTDLADIVVGAQGSDPAPAQSTTKARTRSPKPDAPEPVKAFDDLLGMELLGVKTHEPINVYHTVPQQPPREPRGGGEDAPSPRRGRLLSSALVVVLLILALAGALVARSDACRPRRTTRVVGVLIPPPEPRTEHRAGADAAADSDGEAERDQPPREPAPEPPRRPVRSIARGGKRPDAAVAVKQTPATLSVNTVPWSFVYIDGAKVKATPLLGHRLQPGYHTVEVKGPGGQQRQRLKVHLAPGEHHQLSLDLRDDHE